LHNDDRVALLEGDVQIHDRRAARACLNAVDEHLHDRVRLAAGHDDLRIAGLHWADLRRRQIRAGLDSDYDGRTWGISGTHLLRCTERVAARERGETVDDERPTPAAPSPLIHSAAIYGDLGTIHHSSYGDGLSTGEDWVDREWGERVRRMLRRVFDGRRALVVAEFEPCDALLAWSICGAYVHTLVRGASIDVANLGSV